MKRRFVSSALIAVLIATVLMLPLPGCATAGDSPTFTRDAYNGLSLLVGTYVGANEVRNTYCGRISGPKPAICLDSYQTMLAAYTVISDGDGLLATYIETGTSDSRTKLAALTVRFAALVLDLILLGQHGLTGVQARQAQRPMSRARLAATDPGPTAAEVRALLVGVVAPIDYSK